MGEWVVPLQDFSFVTLLPAHSSWKTGEAQGTGWHTINTQLWART